MIVNLISPDDRYDSLFLSNYATIYVKDELGRLPGVAGITYLGQRDYSLRAWLDPDRLAALNLGPMDVVTAIAQQNLQVAAGQIGQPPAPKGQQFQLTINTLGRLTDPGGVRGHHPQGGPGQPLGAAGADRLVRPGGRDRPGGPVRRGGHGRHQQPQRPGGAGHCHRPPARRGHPDARRRPRVELGSQQYDQSSTLDGQPSVALSVYQLPGSNALDTAAGVYAKMEELKTSFPEGLDYKIVYDTTPFIRESVDEVFSHPARRADPGRHRRAGLPAELAGRPHPADRRPRRDRRHVRRHGRPRLFAQQPVAVRSGAWRSASWSMTPSWSSRTSNAGWSRACRRARRRARRWTR